MSLGLRAHYEERRRRVVLSSPDRESSGKNGGTAAIAKGQQVAPYIEAARSENQPHITDLVPRKSAALILLAMAAVTVVFGIEAAYSLRIEWGDKTPFPAALGLEGYGNLASCYRSVVLGLASLVSSLIYSLRRHRLDDYRAYYRVWLLTAGACLLLAINQAAPFGEAVRAVLLHFTQWGIFAPAGYLWQGGLLGGLAIILGLTMWDMLGDRFCVVVLVAALSLFGSGKVLTLWSTAWSTTPSEFLGMVVAALDMFTCLAILFALVLHARSIVRVVDGEIPASALPEWKRASKKSKATSGSPTSSNASRANRGIGTASLPATALKAGNTITRIDPAHQVAQTEAPKAESKETPAAVVEVATKRERSSTTGKVGGGSSGEGANAQPFAGKVQTGKVRKRLTKAQRKEQRRRQRLEREEREGHFRH